MAMKKLVMFSIMWLLLAGCSEREPVTENQAMLSSKTYATACSASII